MTFTDLSTGGITGWSWTFDGGTPATSTLQNPTVTYNTLGTYNVSLTASNSAGSDGDKVVLVEAGAFKWAKDGGDTPVQADIYKTSWRVTA